MKIDLKGGSIGTLHAFDKKLGIITINVPPRMLGADGGYTYIDQLQYRKQNNGKYAKVDNGCIFELEDDNLLNMF